MKSVKLISALAMTALLSGSLVAAAQSGPQEGPRGNAPRLHAQMTGPLTLGWTTADGNSDGKVDAAEANAALQARFAEADANSDGLLSPEELAAFLKAMEEARADARRIELAKRMIDRADDNGDGAASSDEFRVPRGGADFVRRFDTDKDGTVTKEEYDAKLKALHERMEQRKDKAERGHKGGKHDDRAGHKGHGKAFGKDGRERHRDGSRRADDGAGQRTVPQTAPVAPAAPTQN